MPKQFWLMKSEPDQFGIADLARVRVEPWTGVRSYFARNHMRAMAVGDAVLFHHSNAKPPGVAGVARVVRTGVVDQTQFDPESPYHDPKATREAPIWDCVEVEYVETLPHFVAIDRIRAEPSLADMLLLRRGMRLSVQPVTQAEYERIVALGHAAPSGPPGGPAGGAAPARRREPATPVGKPRSAAGKPAKAGAAKRASAPRANQRPGKPGAASPVGKAARRGRAGASDARPAGAITGRTGRSGGRRS